MKKIYYYLGRGNQKPENIPMWVKANANLNEHISPNHPDNVWIKSKNKKGGIGYWLATKKKPSYIFYIGTANKLTLLWYNFILWLRFLKRKGQKFITKWERTYFERKRLP